MVDNGGPVRSNPPPKLMLAVFNPVFRAVQRTPLARRVPPSFGLLRFTGRRSGRPYDVPVGLHEVGGEQVVFTDARWRLNFRGGQPVTVVSRGRPRSGRGELVEDQVTVGPALQVALAQVGSPRRLGLRVDRGHQPTVDDVRRLGRSMIRIRFDGPAVRRPDGGRTDEQPSDGPAEDVPAAAGGRDDDAPAQGEGAPDSY